MQPKRFSIGCHYSCHEKFVFATPCTERREASNEAFPIRNGITTTEDSRPHQDRADPMDALHAFEISRMSSEVDLKMNILLIDSNGKIREVADADAQIVSDVARMDRDMNRTMPDMEPHSLPRLKRWSRKSIRNTR